MQDLFHQQYDSTSLARNFSPSPLGRVGGRKPCAAFGTRHFYPPHQVRFLPLQMMEYLQHDWIFGKQKSQKSVKYNQCLFSLQQISPSFLYLGLFLVISTYHDLADVVSQRTAANERPSKLSSLRSEITDGTVENCCGPNTQCRAPSGKLTSLEPKGTSPQSYPPQRNKALLRDYEAHRFPLIIP